MLNILIFHSLLELLYFPKIEHNSAAWPYLPLIKCANNRLPCAKCTCQGVIIEYILLSLIKNKLI